MNNKTPKLTLRQKKFADAYLELGNANKAALEAGFEPSYSQGAMRQPAVKTYLQQRIAELIPTTEVVDFLKAVMRGEVKSSYLRKAAAIQLGIRAGLWKRESEAIAFIEKEEF